MVEILVSLGIVSVLSLLVIGSSRKAKSLSAQARCANNLRQIGIAVRSEAPVHQGRLPNKSGTLDGFEVYGSYTGLPISIFRCVKIAPTTKSTYRVAVASSGRILHKMATEEVLLFDAEQVHDKKNALHADGHVALLRSEPQ